MAKMAWEVRKILDEKDAVKICREFVDRGRRGGANVDGYDDEILMVGLSGVVGHTLLSGLEAFSPRYEPPGFADWSTAHPDLGLRKAHSEDRPHLWLFEFKSSGKNMRGDYEKTAAILAQGLYQAYCARSSGELGTIETCLVTGHHPWLRGAFAYARDCGGKMPARHLELSILDGPNGARCCVFEEPMAPWEFMASEQVVFPMNDEDRYSNWFCVPSSGCWYGFQPGHAPDTALPRPVDLMWPHVFLAEVTTASMKPKGWVRYEWDGKQEAWSMLG